GCGWQLQSLSVNGTITPSNENRLKFNEKPIVNALDIINKLEPVEYDQTYEFVDVYTPETPQSHQSGFIAQSVQKIGALKHVVVGGKIGEDGTESIRGLNYNAIFAYAVKSNTRVEPNREGSTGANRRAASTARNHLLITLPRYYRN
ncbi:MAG: tail fiber domain-containing protein, partial [Candidatus Fonsibacter sp.]